MFPQTEGGESVEMPCNEGHYVQAREMNGVRRFVPDDQSAWPDWARIIAVITEPVTPDASLH